MPGPRDDLFQALRASLGELPFIAEDLGMITEEVHALRERLEIPGMKVLQFGFGDPGAHIYLPQNFEPNCVVYTGTHDNDTTAGWWESSASEEERRHAATYFGEPSDGMHWALIRAAFASVAQTGDCALAGRAGPGQRGPHEHAFTERRQLGLALCRGRPHRQPGGKACALSSVCDRTPKGSTR